MNSCETYQELISRLVDGEISREEHEALMAHMNTCSRCNAMYAVFHDLSDILSEEPEPLPEGLHENIMAGVRRSEMIKKNRRMRTFGLRMALSAAACALLVLFAASGFGPGRRAEDVSLRTQEAAEQLYQAPAAESLPKATEDIFSLPMQTQAPASGWTSTPAETFALPATPDAFLAAGNTVNETQNTLQPEQYNQYQLDQYVAPVTVQTPAPAQYYEPFTVAQTPAPAEAQMAAPAAIQTPAAVMMQTPAPVEAQTPVEAQAPTSVPEQVSAPAAVQNTEAPMLRWAAPESAAAQDDAAASESSETGEESVEAVPFSMLKTAPAPTESKVALTEETEDLSADLFLFDGVEVKFASDLPDDPSDGTASADGTEQSSLPAQDAVPEQDDVNATLEADSTPAPEETGNTAEEPAAEKTEIEEQTVKIHGKEGHDRLLALLGDSRSELPAEAILTRAVHVTLVPDDVYGGEEKVDISIYGDFVYYRLYTAENGAESYRADCSLKDLDSLLKTLTEADAQPSPTPTADPYALETETA